MSRVLDLQTKFFPRGSVSSSHFSFGYFYVSFMFFFFLASLKLTNPYTIFSLLLIIIWPSLKFKILQFRLFIFPKL